MWHDTTVTKLFGIKYPIVQGPFGGDASSVRLLTKVSNLGGLGSFGMQTLNPSEMRQIIKEIRVATDKPFAINLWISRAHEFIEQEETDLQTVMQHLRPYYHELGIEMPDMPARLIPDVDEQLATVLELKPKVFSFIFGIPRPEFLRECRTRGIVTMGTATTAEEARQLEAAGVDCVVASGFEAGGHKGSFIRSAESSMTGTMAHVPQCVDATNIPVIAAGGIADARGIAAALYLGASGVQIGTAFLACAESGATPPHRAALFSPDSGKTKLTRAVTGRLARNIYSKYVEEMDKVSEHVAPYPLQAWFVSKMRKPALEQGRFDLLSFPAGQSTPLLRYHTVGELMHHLTKETPELMKTLLDPVIPPWHI